ncbi:DUF4148 domain-containing protein [bacterium]|nr:MAG: DUF4148 domain-containing protein [bacterium]
MRHSFFSGAPVRATLAASALALYAVALATPASAQGNPAASMPVTRAQVRAELGELVGAGYNPRDWYHYPDNLQAAELIIEQRHSASALASGQPLPQTRAVADTSSAAMTNEAVGGVKSGTSMSGSPNSDVIPSTCHGFPVCTLPYIGR